LGEEREEKHVPWDVYLWIEGDAENGVPRRAQRSEHGGVARWQDPSG